MALEAQADKEAGHWQYDSEVAPDFRICSECGSVFRIQSGEGRYNFCPECGKRMEGRI